MLTAGREKALIINADSSTPMLPVWMPERILEVSASIGNVLTGLEINTALVAERVTILKEYPFIGVMGYAAGENPFSYPELKYDRIKLFLAEAAKLVDYVILDCSSNMLNFFTPTAIEAADVTVRILTPDLRGLNYLRAHKPLLTDDKFHYDSHLTFAGLARPFHAIDEMDHLIGGFDGLLPYAKEIERCGTSGQMFKALAYCNQRYISSLKLVRERLMKPEGDGDAPLQEENSGFYGNLPEDTGDVPLQEKNGGFHEDASSQKNTKGSWYVALAGNGRQEAPAGKGVGHHGHGIPK
ncbi:hypothetical protein [Faecalibaculum rodentium]|uniref:hypothetical protein n=1 Tax=Faecalibaculum rodentium TaxID=1702221 RepID=UPI00262F2994|nr:hypothetical protein [Faecalibaculum rodentium]